MSRILSLRKGAGRGSHKSSIAIGKKRWLGRITSDGTVRLQNVPSLSNFQFTSFTSAILYLTHLGNACQTGLCCFMRKVVYLWRRTSPKNKVKGRKE